MEKLCCEDKRIICEKLRRIEHKLDGMDFTIKSLQDNLKIFIRRNQEIEQELKRKEEIVNNSWWWM